MSQAIGVAYYLEAGKQGHHISVECSDGWGWLCYGMKTKEEAVSFAENKGYIVRGTKGEGE